MELNFNPKVSAVPRAVPQTKATPAVKANTAVPEFAGAAALESALNRIPEVRSEAVSRGRELAGQSDYPSTEALGRVATVLAKQLSSPQLN